MRNFLLSVILLICAIASAQKERYQIGDYWSLSQKCWVESNRFLRNYDAQGLLISDSNETWYGDYWNCNSRNLYTYDAGGRLIHKLHEVNTTGTWKNLDRYTCSYDDSGNPIEELFENHTDTNTWYIDRRLVHTYDAGTGYLILSESMQVNYEDTSYVNNRRTSFTYYPDGKLLATLKMYQNYLDTTWYSDARNTYTYNPNGTILQRLDEYWSSPNNEWRTGGRKIYDYDAHGNCIQEKEQGYNPGDVWNNQLVIDYTYDENNRVISQIFENLVVFSWHSRSELYYYYKTDGSLYRTISKVESEQTGNIEYSMRTTWYNEMPEPGFRIFPNPVVNELTVLTAKTEGVKTVSVVSLSGTTVMRKQFNGKDATIDVSALNPGVYLLFLAENGNVSMERFVKYE